MKLSGANHEFCVLILLYLALPGTGYGQASSDATLSGLTVSPVPITGFDGEVTSYHVGVANDVTQVTVTPTANNSGAAIDVNGSQVTSGAAHSVALSEGRNDVAITVTANDGRTTRKYVVTVGRSVTTAYGWNAVKDFNTLRAAAGNRTVDGIWSDGTTMWVADEFDDEKLYAYDMTSRERVPSKDFNTLDAAGNDSPTGIWSDGATMWVADDFDEKLYAYDMTSREHFPSKD